MKQEYTKPEIELVRFTAEEIMNNIIDGSLGTGDDVEGWD